MFNDFVPTLEQKKILTIKTGQHLVLAPPGCGKTELLSYRVFYAKQDGYSDKDIICLTFTNRAAKGMKERIEEKYPNNDIIIGNIHHFCSRFLFKNKLIPLNTSILDEEESDQLIKELKNEYNYHEKVYNPDLIKFATYLKQKNLGFPDNLLLQPRNISNINLAKKICEAYNLEKEDNNYLDFDDLLTLTYFYLNKSNKKKFVLSQFNWIQVDEVQDLNIMQWAIIREITAPGANIVYFGDYEQAIFSFMGAKLEFLQELEQTLKSNGQNGVHHLSQNFRSPSYLLDIYIKYAKTLLYPSWQNAPISNIKQNAPRNALGIFEIEGTVFKEANFIAHKILPKLPDSNTAILVRYNETADIICSYLKDKEIPYFKISGFDIFRRKLVKGIIAFFSIFHNEFDRMSWARLFYEFNAIDTLKESRTFINELFTKGMTVIDILEYNGKSSRLIKFFKTFKNQEIIVFDTETTGLDIENDDIIQIAAIKLKNGIINDVFEIYIQTEKDVSMSEKVHNISKEYLNINGVSHEKGLSDFLKFCGSNAVLVAHNIDFDYAILQKNLSRYFNKSLSDYVTQKFDSVTLSKLIYPNLSSYKLKDLLEFLNVEGTNSHNALDDVKATVSLIKRLERDFQLEIRSSQSQFLENPKNELVVKKFIEHFKHIYMKTKGRLDQPVSLRNATDMYLSYYKNRFLPKNNYLIKEKWLRDWNTNQEEIKKLLNHFDFYTNKNVIETLQQKIFKYIPDYKMFKESDLYLGNEKVMVSTVYKAKGLEFDNVIVAEATDDIYPSYRSITDKEKIEDARLFYVAMTRAKRRLFITSHTISKFNRPRKPSRFVNCIRNFFELS